MSSIEFSLNEQEIRKIQERLKRLSPKEQFGIIETGLKNVASLTQQRLVANVSNRILKRRTGNLAKSIQWRTEAGLVAFVGSNVLSGRRIPYANIHETGGILRPKKKYLAVPLPAALTKAGATKMPSPRDFKNTFVKKSKAGNLIIFQKRGASTVHIAGYGKQKTKASIVPLFVLKKSVKIPARRYMSLTLQQVRPRISQIMNATISRELDQ